MSIGVSVYDRQAATNTSLHAIERRFGRPSPPHSALLAIATKPFSTNVLWNAFWHAGTVTFPASNFAPTRSDSALIGQSCSFARS